MSKFCNFLKASKLKAKSYKLNKGMTYVELIVVLTIFAVMSSIVMYNYGDFQAKVDLKNLASDMALKIVEAQRSSLSGNLPPTGEPSATWKPSYGVYFDLATDDADNKSFIYFVDLNSNGMYDGGPDCSASDECLDKIYIQRGGIFIASIEACYSEYCYSGEYETIEHPLSITFKRPGSGAFFHSPSEELIRRFHYVQVSVHTPQAPPTIANIKIYRLGRIQVDLRTPQVEI